MERNSKARRAFTAACCDFGWNTPRRAVISISVALVALVCLFVLGGRDQGIEESIVKSAAAAATLLIFPAVFFLELAAPDERGKRLKAMSIALIGIGLFITIAGIAVIGLGASQLYDDGGIAEEQVDQSRTDQQQPTAAERQAAQRSAFLQHRDRLEAPLAEVGGILIDYSFPEKGIGRAKIEEGDNVYFIPLTAQSGTGVWIYNEHDSIKALYKIGETSRGELIDLQMFRASKRSEALEIGETAVIEMADGKLIEILIVAVRYHGAGDEKEKVSFRYKIHSADEQPIKGL